MRFVQISLEEEEGLEVVSLLYRLTFTFYSTISLHFTHFLFLCCYDLIPFVRIIEEREKEMDIPRAIIETH